MSSQLVLDKREIFSTLKEKGIKPGEFGKQLERDFRSMEVDDLLSEIADRFDVRDVLSFELDEENDDLSGEVFLVEEILGRIALGLFDTVGMSRESLDVLTSLSLLNKLTQVIRGEFVREMLLAFKYLGMLDLKEPIYVNDICGGSGVLLQVLGIVRKNLAETVGACVDLDPRKKREFDLLRSKIGNASSERVKFLEADVRDCDLKGDVDKKKYWLARFPGSVVNEIFERLMEMDKEDRPEAMAIFPCKCHCYGEESYPIKGVSNRFADRIVSEDEWRKLSVLARTSYERGTSEAALSKEAQRLMDCFRAYCFKLKMPSMQHGVRVFSDRSSSHMIYSKAI